MEFAAEAGEDPVPKVVGWVARCFDGRSGHAEEAPRCARAADRGRGGRARVGRGSASSRCCAAPMPTASLPRSEFEEILRMLAEGYTTRRGRHGALIYHDAINQQVKPRRGARLTALTSGGAIPDTADYQVILEPQAQFVGTVNEDFAVESLQRGHLPAWQRLLPHPARGTRAHPRGGCARPAAARSRSGWARPRGAALSCRRVCRGCAASSRRELGAGIEAATAWLHRRRRHDAVPQPCSW